MNSEETQILTSLFDLGRYISAEQLEDDITVIQLRTLGYIYKTGKVKPTQISKYLEITPASVTSQIDSLVEKGYIERVYSQLDKRVIEVTLTDKGSKVFLKSLKELKERCSWVFENITKQETKMLIKFIDRIRKKYNRN